MYRSCVTVKVGIRLLHKRWRARGGRDAGQWQNTEAVQGRRCAKSAWRQVRLPVTGCRGQGDGLYNLAGFATSGAMSFDIPANIRKRATHRNKLQGLRCDRCCARTVRERQAQKGQHSKAQQGGLEYGADRKCHGGDLHRVCGMRQPVWVRHGRSVSSGNGAGMYVFGFAAFAEKDKQS